MNDFHLANKLLQSILLIDKWYVLLFTVDNQWGEACLLLDTLKPQPRTAKG